MFSQYNMHACFFGLHFGSHYRFKLLMQPPYGKTTEFAQYWFQGKAEVNHYKLEQNCYGEMRKGYAVLVFVTEDFTSKQVKADNSDCSVSGAVPVMKFTPNRKFITGIYDYANMTSVFTPLDAIKHPQTFQTASPAFRNGVAKHGFRQIGAIMLMTWRFFLL